MLFQTKWKIQELHLSPLRVLFRGEVLVYWANFPNYNQDFHLNLGKISAECLLLFIIFICIY